MVSYIVGDSNSLDISIEGFENLSELGSRAEDIIFKLQEVDCGDILIIAVGVNDAAHIKSSVSDGEIEPNIAVFKQTYSKLLKIAQSKFSRVVAVGLVPSDEKETFLGTAIIQYRNREITKFNEKIKELCRSYEVDFVDILPYFLGNENELLVDHIHPSEKGQEIISQELSKILDESSFDTADSSR